MTVRKFEEVLRDAKQKFHKRAERAFPDIVVPPNMENWFLLRLTGDADLQNALMTLKNRPETEIVTFDYPIDRATHRPELDDSTTDRNWALKNHVEDYDVNVIPAWNDPAIALRPIVVAVLDTGFKEDLDALAGRLWTNPDEQLNPNDGLDNNCENGYVDDVHGITTFDPLYDPRQDFLLPEQHPCGNGPQGVAAIAFDPHATEVAGIIAADHDVHTSVLGTAGDDNVQLMNISLGYCALSASLQSGAAEVAAGLEYAIIEGADIANMSFTGRVPTPVFQDAILSALSVGKILVAGAGNEGVRFGQGSRPTFARYPALFDGVIAVGGLDRQGQQYGNYGPGIDFVAPAVIVKTITYTDPTQTNAQITMSTGTSASAAYTSGVAALVLSRYDYITAPYMVHWLRRTARDVGAPGEDIFTGAGLLNAGDAVTTVSVGNRPIAVDIKAERFAYALPNGVAGSPDLGITVTTPDVCIQPDQPNLCLDRWTLHWGPTDAPVSKDLFEFSHRHAAISRRSFYRPENSTRGVNPDLMKHRDKRAVGPEEWERGTRILRYPPCQFGLIDLDDYTLKFAGGF